MKNWMLELEEKSDAETAKITIQAFSGVILFIAIIAGNWNFLA